MLKWLGSCWQIKFSINIRTVTVLLMLLLMLLLLLLLSSYDCSVLVLSECFTFIFSVACRLPLVSTHCLLLFSTYTSLIRYLIFVWHHFGMRRNIRKWANRVLIQINNYKNDPVYFCACFRESFRDCIKDLEHSYPTFVSRNASFLEVHFTWYFFFLQSFLISLYRDFALTQSFPSLLSSVFSL